MTQPLHTHIEQFHQEGYTVFRQAMPPELLAAVKEQVDQAYAEADDPAYGPLVRTRMFERGGAMLNLIELPPVVDFAEAVLGSTCHVIAMNALRTPRGTGVDGWHVDDELIFPLPENVALDERIQMPPIFFNCLYPLVDVHADMGPTQLVPGSHRSGRHPAKPPIYKGQEPISLTAQAGDCIIFNSQIWHRGARNESDTTRIVQGVTYGKRWVSQRFYPFVNYAMPPLVADALNPRQRRLLGFHEHGAYG